MSAPQYQMVPEYDSLEGLCQDETKVFNMFRYYGDEDTRYGPIILRIFLTNIRWIPIEGNTDAMITLRNTCSDIIASLLPPLTEAWASSLVYSELYSVVQCCIVLYSSPTIRRLDREV